jgi:hypothetical protein
MQPKRASSVEMVLLMSTFAVVWLAVGVLVFQG